MSVYTYCQPHGQLSVAGVRVELTDCIRRVIEPTASATLCGRLIKCNLGEIIDSVIGSDIATGRQVCQECRAIFNAIKLGLPIPKFTDPQPQEVTVTPDHIWLLRRIIELLESDGITAATFRI